MDQGVTSHTSRVWRLENDVDTDQLIPSQYLVLDDPQEMARHCLETCRTEFANEVRPGDIIVAGDNFGCGSSREQAVVVLKTLGVAAIIAKGFSRIFFRNAINNALPVITTEHADLFEDASLIHLDMEQGVIFGRDEEVSFAPYSGMPKAILEAGGLIAYLRLKETQA